MMEPMKFENPVYEDEILDGIVNDVVDENIAGIMSEGTAFAHDRVGENNADSNFQPDQDIEQAHADRVTLDEQLAIMERKRLAKVKEDLNVTPVSGDIPLAINEELLAEKIIIDQKNKFINKYMEENHIQLKNQDRNELYLKLRLDKGHIYYTDNEHDFRLTKENHEPYAQGSINKAGASKFKSYFKEAAGDTPKAAVQAIGRPKKTNLSNRLNNAADEPEEIGLATMEENEPETGFAESSFSAPALRNRSLNYISAEPTMADQQIIFEALRDVDIVEFVQKPRDGASEIDIQLHNAKKLQFDLEQAKTNLKSAKEHNEQKWIKDVNKEIESIELHLKTIAGKLARLYADKFYDESLSLPTRLRYLIKLKGFKIGVIVSAIGIAFSAIVAGLVEMRGPATVVGVAKALGNATADAIKKIGETIGPTVNNLFESVRTRMWKIVLWAIGIVASVVKGIFGYLAEHVIIMLAVVVLVILQIIAKNAGTITHRAKNISK